MIIVNLLQSSKMYTSNAYLVTGAWNTLDDVNTLVDVGRDPRLIGITGTTRSGAGQKKVSQVILTHCLITLKLLLSGFGLVALKNILLHLSRRDQIEMVRMFHEAQDEYECLQWSKTRKLPLEASQAFEPVITGGIHNECENAG